MSRQCSKDLRRFAFSVFFTAFVSLSLIATYPRGLPVDDTTNRRKTTTSSAAALRSSFDLARRESLGLFQNIPNEQWILQRNHARYLAVALNQSDLTNGVVIPMITCPHTQQIGNSTESDAQVLVCEPKQLYKRADCLIYSIGPSRSRRGFENELYATYGRNCEIHVFDLDSETNLEAEKKNIYYHNWELWRSTTYTDSKLSNIISFSQAMEQLGHTGRRIDLLHIAGAYTINPDNQLPKSIDVRQLVLSSDVTLDHAYLDHFINRGLVPFVAEAQEGDSVGDGDNGGGGRFVRVHASFLDRPNKIAVR